MSKRETPMIRRYWKQVGGTLVEEFPVVKGTRACGRRVVDAIILPNRKRQISHWRDISLEGEEVILVQAKFHRLGMYLMGQTFFSAQLIRKFRPASVVSVALCTKDDSILRPLIEKYRGMKVVVLRKPKG